MAGRIPRPFIDDLLNKADIVEIIDSRVPLKKKGREYWACCPFHGEKSASFSVSQNKQFYHCFGCQASGNVLGFLMDYDNLEFVEAVETLAQNLGLEVPYESGQAPQKNLSQTDPLFDALKASTDFFQNQLKSSPVAVEYLKQRGISGEIARDYAIGYAPPGWNNLPGNAKALLDSGMTIAKDNGQSYDRFRHRLMFPIRDRRGRTIAFGGRVIDKEGNPKYLNSPESPLFHKGEEIYGLFELRKAVVNIDKIFVTEGYMDVVALAEHGVRTAVATLGTAINNDQIEKLFRQCKNLVFCFDGDQAGKKAAWRSLEQCLPSLKEGRLARFLFLPEGQDPDSYIQQFGKSAFEEMIERSSTLTAFLFDTLSKESNIRTLEGRAQFLDRLRPYFGQIPLQSLKDQILTELETRFGMKVDARLKATIGAVEEPQQRDIKIPESRWTPTKLAINLLLQKPELAQSTGTHHELIESDIPGADLLLALLDQIHEEPDISTQNLLDRFKGDPNETHLYKLAVIEPAMQADTSVEEMFDGCMQQLQTQFIKDRRKKRIAELQSNSELSESDKRELRQLFTKR